MLRRHQSDREQGVEILDLVLAALAVRTVRAVNLVQALERGGIQHDQDPSAEAVPVRVLASEMPGTVVVTLNNTGQEHAKLP